MKKQDSFLAKKEVVFSLYVMELTNLKKKEFRVEENI